MQSWNPDQNFNKGLKQLNKTIILSCKSDPQTTSSDKHQVVRSRQLSVTTLPLTLSTPHFVKLDCNILKFCIYSCSKFVLYFIFLSGTEPESKINTRIENNEWTVRLDDSWSILAAMSYFYSESLCKVTFWLMFESFVCLCWGLTSQSTIFQSCRDGATTSWVINQYFRGVKCLAQGHNTAAVGFEPPTSRSGVRHSTTEPPRSPCLKVSYMAYFLLYFVSFPEKVKSLF